MAHSVLTKEQRKEYYQRWKAKQIEADPDYFKHRYEQTVARYGKDKLNERSKKWRKKHPEYGKDFRRTHKEYHAKKSYEWRKKNVDAHKASVVRWIGKHPEIQAAHYAATHGIGKFDPVPLAEFCETCPDDDKRKALHRHS